MNEIITILFMGLITICLITPLVGIFSNWKKEMECDEDAEN